jgi:4-hydroxybenzoate polyprenyltransferase
MSQICRLLIWICGFVIASAIAQLISLLPWSVLVVGVATVVTYSQGKADNSMLLQVIAIGLAFGWMKCYFAG